MPKRFEKVFFLLHRNHCFASLRSATKVSEFLFFFFYLFWLFSLHFMSNIFCSEKFVDEVTKSFTQETLLASLSLTLFSVSSSAQKSVDLQCFSKSTLDLIELRMKLFIQHKRIKLKLKRDILLLITPLIPTSSEAVIAVILKARKLLRYEHQEEMKHMNWPRLEDILCRCHKSKNQSYRIFCIQSWNDKHFNLKYQSWCWKQTFSLIFLPSLHEKNRCEEWHWMTGKWDHKIKSFLAFLLSPL